MNGLHLVTSAAGLAVLMATELTGGQQESDPPADLVIIHARVWTGSNSLPEAQAVAIRDGKIVRVGNDADVSPLAGADTKVIDAKGRRVIPGLIDCHTHIVSGGLHMARVNLRDVHDRAEFVRRVAARVNELKPGQWVLGGRWTVDSWADPTPPARDWIDSVTPDNPAFLSRMDGHMALANSAALKLAGITRDTPPDPEGGTIDRDPYTGQPTGLLRDAAMNLVEKHIAPPSDLELDQALLRAMRHANRWGITMVHDMSSPSEWAAVARAGQAGSLPLRLCCFLNAPDWTHNSDDDLSFRQRSTQDWGLVGFKGFMDGSLGARTAYMAEPYADNPPERKDWRGLLNEMADPPREITERCLLADRYGWQTAVHAIGDEAIHLLLNTYEEVQRTNGPRDRRQRIEHAQHIKPSDIKRFAELGVIASLQPLHKADDGRYAEQAIGTHRLKGSYAFRSLLESGATLCFGSDWPVVSLNPFEGMAAAVTGRTHDGKIWIPEENITIEQALRCYTRSAARACFMEDKLGTIEPGKLADLALLDRDPLTIPPDQIAHVQPVHTLVAGSVVYSSE